MEGPSRGCIKLHIIQQISSVKGKQLQQGVHIFCIFVLSCALTALGGSPAKSGPLDFRTKDNSPSFFVSEKGLAHI